VRPTSLIGSDGKESSLSSLAGKRVFAFAGIAQPDSFRLSIESLGGRVAGFIAFGDHHRYTAEDMRRIERELAETGAEILLTTEKDGVKLSAIEALRQRLSLLAVETEILEGADALETALRVCIGVR